MKFSSDPRDETPAWVLPEGHSVPIPIGEKDLLETSISTNSEETANPEDAEEAEDPSTLATNPEEDLPAAPAPKKRRKRKKMSGRSRRRVVKRKLPPSPEVFISHYQHELLEWALDGFPPCGAPGLWPSDEEQEELEQEVGPVPVGPGGRAIRDMAGGEPQAKRAKVVNVVKPMIRGAV